MDRHLAFWIVRLLTTLHVQRLSEHHYTSYPIFPWCIVSDKFITNLIWTLVSVETHSEVLVPLPRVRNLIFRKVWVHISSFRRYILNGTARHHTQTNLLNISTTRLAVYFGMLNIRPSEIMPLYFNEAADKKFNNSITRRLYPRNFIVPWYFGMMAWKGRKISPVGAVNFTVCPDLYLRLKGFQAYLCILQIFQTPPSELGQQVQ